MTNTLPIKALLNPDLDQQSELFEIVPD